MKGQEQPRTVTPHGRSRSEARRKRVGGAGAWYRPWGGPYQVWRRCGLLWWALVFLIIAIIAAIFGFGGIAAAAATVAKILFFIFLAIFVISLIAALVRRA